MPKYAYSDYRVITEEGSERTLSLPVVRFIVTGSKYSFSGEALLDSGAPLCFFTRRAATGLGLVFSPYSQSQTSINVRVAGSTHVAFKAPVQINIGNSTTLDWNTSGWFFYADWKLSPPNLTAIFGAEGFFDRWSVSFNRPKKYFTIEPP